MKTTQNVCAGIVHHRHGISVFLGTTDKALESELYDYVCEWWPEFCKGKTPKNRKKAIEKYFEAADGDEWCDYENAQVVGL